MEIATHPINCICAKCELKHRQAKDAVIAAAKALVEKLKRRIRSIEFIAIEDFDPELAALEKELEKLS